MRKPIFPLKNPTLIETMKLRMYERGLNQKRLSELLGVSTSRVSEYLTGKTGTNIKNRQETSVKNLDIDPTIVLGL